MSGSSVDRLPRSSACLSGGASLPVDRGERPVDDGECTQAEKIELHKADRLDVVLVELGDCTGCAGLAIERGEIGEASGRDHDAPGVPPGVAGQSFELARQIDDRPDVFVRLVALLQSVVGECTFERHSQLERDELRNLVDESVGVAEHPANVTHDRLGGHGPERDDLSDMVGGVPGSDIVDDAVAALHAEIDIEIR